ncbi:MAG: RHS repeat-associated core domain-containing protein [Planctomycetia bacterium]|nr:RHS repeat-associated core domain-containing protein [Planctomycetia bacterium]
MKVGYDADDDDDLDGSDDVVIDEDFAAATVSPTHDDAGNLTKDADYAYVFDAWNNLVKVRAQNDADVVVGVYAYYADNRRASKTVTNRGDLDGVTYFFYDGLREIEERNGSEQVTQQYVWGHEYIDQLLMIRGASGTWFVHQDANWNVIALTTPNGDVAEEVQYQPYGSPQVRRRLAFGDSDADGDVDSADNTAHTNALSTYNRAFDADFDGDVSNTSGDADQLAWDASYNDPAASTTMVIPNRSFSPTGNPFLFTGRRLDAETGLYFYRFRTYHPVLKQFLQRDPLGYVDSASLYQYVGGRPTAAGDPLGLEKVVIMVGEDAGWWGTRLANAIASNHRYFGHDVELVHIHGLADFERFYSDDSIDRLIFIGHGWEDAAGVVLRIRRSTGKRKKDRQVTELEELTPEQLAKMRRGKRLRKLCLYACYQGNDQYGQQWRTALGPDVTFWAPGGKERPGLRTIMEWMSRVGGGTGVWCSP